LILQRFSGWSGREQFGRSDSANKVCFDGNNSASSQRNLYKRQRANQGESMVFGRRVKPRIQQRIRAFFWPKTGLKRSTSYILKRVSRLNATPHAIAAGFAAGAAASFTPFVGFHFIIGFALAWLARGSMVAAAFGTAIGNPLTFPLIFAATWETGQFLLGLLAVAVPPAADAAAHGQAVLQGSLFAVGFKTLWPVVKTMILGSIPLGLVAFAVFYLLMRSVVTAFQRTRRARRAHRAAARLARKAAAQKAGGGGAAGQLQNPLHGQSLGNSAHKSAGPPPSLSADAQAS
jgi:uncharacterized protein